MPDSISVQAEPSVYKQKRTKTPALNMTCPEPTSQWVKGQDREGKILTHLDWFYRGENNTSQENGGLILVIPTPATPCAF
jgi:hypothetical protein